MRGNTELERQKLPKPSEFGMTELTDIDPRVAITNRATQRDEDHFDQRIILTTIDAGVCNFFKVLRNCFNEC